MLQHPTHLVRRHWSLPNPSPPWFVIALTLARSLFHIPHLSGDQPMATPLEDLGVLTGTTFTWLCRQTAGELISPAINGRRQASERVALCCRVRQLSELSAILAKRAHPPFRTALTSRKQAPEFSSVSGIPPLVRSPRLVCPLRFSTSYHSTQSNPATITVGTGDPTRCAAVGSSSGAPAPTSGAATPSASASAPVASTPAGTTTPATTAATPSGGNTGTSRPASSNTARTSCVL